MLAPDFRARWLAIRGRADSFAGCAARLGLELSWGEGNPFDAAAPPASEAELRAVERAVGFELPLSLRQVFLEGSAALAFAWSLPHRGTMRGGIPEIVYDALPPPPFRVEREAREGQAAGPARRVVPRIAGGCVSIVLDHVEPLVRQARARAAGFAERSRHEGGAAMRRHLARVARAWADAVPFAGVGDGDLIAVDAGDPAERIVCVSHEGAPTYALGRPLLDHLEVASRLGFVWHDRLFADAAASRALEESASDEGLPVVEAGVMSADGADAAAWRAWLGWPEE